MIVSLQERPEFIDACTAWVFAEWLSIGDQRSLEKTRNGYVEDSKNDNLPSTYIYILENKAVGMASLKNEEHPDRTDLTPWLGSVYVHPLFRGKGIAKALCEKVENEAKNLRHETLYLQTHIPAVYKKLGWETIGKVRDVLGIYNDDNDLMSKNLFEKPICR